MKAFAAACLLLLAIPAHAAESAPQTSLAMHGAAKYSGAFNGFSYVNPDAPKGGALKLSVSGSFDSLNPFVIRGTPALGLNTGYLSLVYESLMARSWDEPFTLYGLLAQSVEVPEDRSSIVFNLDPAAHFADGQPVTADDVLFSWQTLRDKGRPNHRSYYKKVEKAEKLGERRVKFSFKPLAAGGYDREMPLIMGLMPIIPAHDWNGRDFNKASMRVPTGSGPYKIAAVDPGRSVTYARDPNYWGVKAPAQRGLYNFDTIRIDYYRDDGIALQGFKAHQFDWRREANVNLWVTSYDFPAAHDGRVKLETLPHHRTEPATGLIFNTRRAPFDDPAFRSALEYSFDSGWVNKNLFHGQYHRVDSFFPNSELAAPPLPQGKELELLEKYRDKLPPAIFTTPVTPPSTDGGEEALRDNLLKGAAMLKEAGYVLKGDALYAPNAATPVSFEILLNDPAEEKLALTWARALKRLGISARAHTVDSAQYQARLAGFNFDVTSNKWINTLSPGNEQTAYWGSAAASTPGSRNYAGVHDPVIDALAAAIPAAQTREDLVAATHALDRVLMAGHYDIPLFYLGADDIAYWSNLRHPAIMPVYGSVLESWWAVPATQAQ